MFEFSDWLCIKIFNIVIFKQIFLECKFEHKISFIGLRDRTRILVAHAATTAPIRPPQ